MCWRNTQQNRFGNFTDNITEKYFLSNDNSMACSFPNISEKFAIKKTDILGNNAEQVSIMQNQNVKKISAGIEK